jgi:deazaflavin-dependent oxidoreductase (nitroreductase family)
MSDWNKSVIAEFRANGGKVAQFGDLPVVILHTVGAKSGQIREIPLVALKDDHGMYVFASKAGASTNPDWLYNLRANPNITVEHGSDKFQAQVVELPEAARASKLAAQIAIVPTFGDYERSAAPRLIPVLRIDPLG